MMKSENKENQYSLYFECPTREWKINNLTDFLSEQGIKDYYVKYLGGKNHELKNRTRIMLLLTNSTDYNALLNKESYIPRKEEKSIIDTVCMRKYIPPSERRKSYQEKICRRIYVNYLPLDTTEEEIKSVFIEYGEIETIFMSRNASTLNVYIDFLEAKSAKNALNSEMSLRRDDEEHSLEVINSEILQKRKLMKKVKNQEKRKRYGKQKRGRKYDRKNRQNKRNPEDQSENTRFTKQNTSSKTLFNFRRNK